MEKIAEFSVGLTRILDPAGTVIGDLPAFADDPDELIALYRGMALTRAFE